ncbi:Uncharacterised protein [Legionella beliardensis]|uniref:Uncharacterized protein n=1 Tax=Legionella beliardensis TaxID=91822 RepID=A0A378HYT2_9GAMM|nr:hypothetical protein [Legionella beliardensis]STX28068.1 Uncharacterised protein [Legionella beliardensis]
MSIRPEEILPDDKNFANINGINVRKGTVASALANADILDSNSATEAEKAEALKMIKTLAPALIALGLTKHLTWKNSAIQQVINDCLQEKKLS